MRRDSAAILAVGGVVSAAIGSIDVEFSVWAARVMLLANLAVLALWVAWLRGSR